MVTTVDDTTGVGAHYWTVTLTPPKGAPIALQEFVAMAEEALQTSVDLLGRGAPALPPVVDDLLTSTTYQELGAGAGAEGYQARLAEVNKRKDSLLETDKSVLRSAITVSARNDSTLKYIERLVEQLESQMAAITGELTSAQCAAVMQQIGYVMDIVNSRVIAVYEANHGTAGTGSGGTDGQSAGSGGASDTGGSGSAGTGSGGGSAGSGVGSGGSDMLSSLIGMVPVLGMVGMMALPLLMQVIPKVLEALDPNAHQHGDQNQDQNGSTGPSGASSRTDSAQPSAPAPQAAATPAVSAPPSAAPAVAPPQTVTPPSTGAVPQTVTPPPTVTAPQPGKTLQADTTSAGAPPTNGTSPTGTQQVQTPPGPSNTATTPASVH